ncbi:unnamed protein product [Paramecium sonneborni]|uniref:Uncharacterized protein n=1 Tax=Paramecium sonneborni TaxID=65129 RepID=A0A8S1JYK1_9CILI|nr:unnamed protein product [Paramecium sonneborni]
MTLIEQKNQQVLELLRNFVLDYSNIELFQSLILEDGNPETTFVLYSIIQKCLINGDHFTNFPHQNVSTEYFIINMTIDQILQKFVLNILRLHSFIYNNHIINQITFTIKQFLQLHYQQEKIGLIFQKLKILQVKLQIELYKKIKQLSLQRILQAIHLQIQQLQGEPLIKLYGQNKIMVESFINLLYQLMNLNFNLSYYEIDVIMMQRIYHNQLIFQIIIQIQQQIQYFQKNSFKILLDLQILIKIYLYIVYVCFKGLLVQDYQYFTIRNVKEDLEEQCGKGYYIYIKIKINLQIIQIFQLISQIYQKTVQLFGVKIISNSPIVKLQELWNQIGYQGSLHLLQHDSQNVLIKKAMQNQLIIVLKTIFQQNQSTDIPQECSVKKFKKLLDLTFIPFHCLFKLNIQENIGIILQMIEQLRGDNEYQSAAVISLTIVFLLHTSNTEILNLGFDCYNFGQKEDQNLILMDKHISQNLQWNLQ